MYGLKAGTNGPFVTTCGYRSQTDKPLAGITRRRPRAILMIAMIKRPRALHPSLRPFWTWHSRGSKIRHLQTLKVLVDRILTLWRPRMTAAMILSGSAVQTKGLGSLIGLFDEAVDRPSAAARMIFARQNVLLRAVPVRDRPLPDGHSSAAPTSTVPAHAHKLAHLASHGNPVSDALHIACHICPWWPHYYMDATHLPPDLR